jgi:hypothetical protein
MALLREQPGRAWRPVELVDHAAAHGTPHFLPGQSFEYLDTGYVVAGIPSSRRPVGHSTRFTANSSSTR